MRLEEIAEPHDVEGDNLVAGGEQFWDQDGALVAAGASDEEFHGVGCVCTLKGRLPANVSGQAGMTLA